MQRRPNTLVVAVIVGVVALVIGIWWGGHPKSLPGFARDTFVQSDVGVRAELTKDIQDDFYKKVSGGELEQASLKGMVQSLHDRFSEYFTPAEAKVFQQSLSGKFEGVGMAVDSRHTKQGLKGSKGDGGAPAGKAGNRAGGPIVAGERAPTRGG